MPPERMVDVATVARLLNVTAQTVKNWIHAGKIPGERNISGYYQVPLSVVRNLQKPQSDRV